jgi:hypothetical protein
MVIEIQRPEVEALILERMKSGGFESVEDVILQALESTRTESDRPAEPKLRMPGRKSLAALFAESPFRGLELEFERDPDCGRDITV